MVLKWLSVQGDITRATHLQTYKVINMKSPAVLHELMPMNTRAQRIAEHRKLSTKPKWLTKTKITMYKINLWGKSLYI